MTEFQEHGGKNMKNLRNHLNVICLSENLNGLFTTTI